MQGQFDELIDEVNSVNAELDLCIQSGSNTLTNDVTLIGDYLFCGTTSILL